jgi:hypothetical protein
MSDLDFFSIPDPGSRGQKITGGDPGFRSATMFLSVVEQDPDWIRIQMDTGKQEKFFSSSSFLKLDVFYGRWRLLLEISSPPCKSKNKPVAFSIKIIPFFPLNFF